MQWGKSWGRLPRNNFSDVILARNKLVGKIFFPGTPTMHDSTMEMGNSLWSLGALLKLAKRSGPELSYRNMLYLTGMSFGAGCPVRRPRSLNGLRLQASAATPDRHHSRKMRRYGGSIKSSQRDGLRDKEDLLKSRLSAGSTGMETFCDAENRSSF